MTIKYQAPIWNPSLSNAFPFQKHAVEGYLLGLEHAGAIRHRIEQRSGKGAQALNFELDILNSSLTDEIDITLREKYAARNLELEDGYSNQTLGEISEMIRGKK